MVTEDNSYLTSSMVISVFFMVIQIIKATGNNHSLIILFLIFGAMLMCALTYIVYIKIILLVLNQERRDKKTTSLR